MKRFFVLLLAVLALSVSVFAVEVNSDGCVVKLADVPGVSGAGPESSVSGPAVVALSTVADVSSDDAEVVPADDSAGSDASADSGSEDGDLNDMVSPGLLSGASDPVPVVLVDPESDYSTVVQSDGSTSLDIVDEPPSNPPFYGSCYVTGKTASGSTVTLYFPVNYKSGYFGVDSNGYLFNVSSSSISGYYSGGYNNSVTVSGFGYPRYRTTSSSYDYTTMYLIPTASNMDIATDNAPRISVSELLPYVSILLLGVIFLCCMRRS